MFSIIVNGFHKPEYFNIVRDVVDLCHASHCHLIYETEKPALRPATVVQYYQCATLSHHFDYGDQKNFLPLDAPLLEQLSDCEAICLKMMERDEIEEPWSYERRKAAYLTHVRYWNHVIQTEKIKLFIASNIPHVVYDFIIYSLCKHYGIDTLLFYQFQPGLSFAMSDWKTPTPGLKASLAHLISTRGNSTKSLPIHPRLAREVASSSGEATDSVPFYMLPKESPTKGLLGRLRSYRARILEKTGNKLTLSLFFIRLPKAILQLIQERTRGKKLLRARQAAERTYADICQEPDLAIDYIYLPLHLQPELSTSPMAGVYVDQILIAELLEYTMPDHMQLLVKEHPNQDMLARPHAFYQDFSRCKKVRFVSKNFDSRTLIRSSKAVATCTGTAGWEAMLNGTPVLCFGHTFYQDAANVYQIRNLSDCQRALDAILNSNANDRNLNITAFLHLLDSYAVYADVDPDYMNSRNADWKENSETILHAIERNLGSRT